ncbi:MAG TPA: hypothetical protein VMD97_10300 [Candidatus Aquilonibacter sp.]|nr:hypothetical protein [Candidatus Aquilonibacter sp.]
MKMKAMKTLGIAAVAGAALAVAAPAAQAQRVYFGVRARGPVYVAPVPPPVVYVGPGYYYGPHRVWVAPRRFHHHY